MQKLTNRILSALLVLVMVLSMLPASVFATGETGSALEDWDVTLGSNIGVNFYLDKAYTVETTIAGQPASNTAAEIDGKYVVTVGVPAAQLTDTIGLTVKDGATTVHTGEYSVRQYAETILASNEDAEVKEMVKELLNYGAAAQVYFNYNADNLPCEIENDTTIPAESEMVIEDNLDGIDLYGASLVHADALAVRFYFSVSGNIEDYIFSSGKAPVYKDGYYYVEVSNIQPVDMDEEINLVVTKGAETLTVKYSPLTYIVRTYQAAGSSEAQKQLVQALYGYCLEAAEYQEYEANKPLIIDAGTLGKHSSNGWQSSGVYASMAENAAPYNGWSIEYTPTASENLKLIRGGETYNIGFPGRGTLVKYNATDYFLKMEWNVGEYAPMQDGDVLIVEGAFVNEANKATLNIAKTFIYANGSNVEFSTQMPTLPVTIEAGAMSKHSSNGWASNGVYASMAANDAPYSGWSVEYTPVAAENLKLIRGGETYNIGIPGRGTLVKYNATDYFLKMEWNVGEYAPMQDGDILIVEGGFVNNASKVTLNIAKTYIYANGSNVEFSTEMPTLSTTVEGGVMSAVTGYGWTGATGDLIFQMNNSAPSGKYKPTSASVIKLIRNGVTYDVAHTGAEVLNKANDTWYNIAFWTIVDHKPMLANDILVIEGDFYQESTKTTLRVSKTYVLLKDGGAAAFSTEMPSLATVIDAGVMNKHSAHGWNGDALYFSMAENEAPVGDSIRYKPDAASNIKLIRDGVTYDVGHTARETIVKASDTGYYIAMWVLGDYKPLKENDILIVEGGFTNAANNTTLNISKSYILINADGSADFSTEMPTLPTVIDAGVMNKHSSNGWNADALYFSMAENEAPVGDSIRYKPEAASNIKLIRDGVTYDVGHTARETIVKASDTGYYIAMWVLGDYKPLKANDILIVEGAFTNAANKTTLNISKSYILIKADGTAEFSTEMPSLATVIDAGVMQTHPEGAMGNGIRFRLAANDAPYSGWDYEYKQTATSNVQLIRNGVTTAIGIVGRPLIVKYGDIDYYLKLEGWTLGAYGWNDQSDPITTDDVLIIQGEFIHEASNTTLNIAQSYVYYDGTSWVCGETLPIDVDCGVMTENEDGTPEEIFFSMAVNSVPVDEDLNHPYGGTVQMVTGSNVTAVNVNIYKLTDEQYYLEMDAELAEQSYLIVEGAFSNSENGYTMNITRTYVLNDGGELVYSTTEPVLESEFAVTGLTNHSNGWSADGIYISHNAHSAYYKSDWSVRYRPVSADAIKLVRDGEVYNIGQPAGDTLVVYDSAKMYFETKAWTTQGGKLPFVDGDQIIIEGKFKHAASGNILVVEKTVICVNGTDLIFNPIMGSAFGNHSNGLSGEGIYATMAENAAPFDGWSIEYAPVDGNSYYVIRGGEKISIGYNNRGTLVKYSATNYYLKMKAWCTDNFAYTTDDIFVVDGYWKNTKGTEIIKMEKTYLYYDGSAWVFSKNLPAVVQGGVMQTHSNGMSGTGIYFNMASNAAPYNGDWSLEYTQTSVDGVKLIRGGETISIGIVDRPLFLKYSETGYYLKLEGWTLGSYVPLTTDDILIIEGNFYHKASNTTLNIAKSYVYYDGTAWICSAEAPETKNVVDVKELGSHSNGWTTGGFYFTAAANDAPLNTDWSLRYKPLAADAIKLVHNGTVTNKGNTGAETIVKYSETNYYIEGWAVGMSGVVAGDQMIIEGLFYNAAHDTYINVEKTTITFNADGSTTVISESGKYINAGYLSTYEAGPNWFGNGIYFALESNNAPFDTDWNVRYKPKDNANIKLIRNGETINIANTGAETIVKIADGMYWLSLENWWWNAYAPIQDGDMLVIEGEFVNEASGFTLNIFKSYITFVSKDNDDVKFSVASNTEFGDVLLPTSSKSVTIGVWNGSHHVFTDARLAELKAAGITKIMGIDPQWIGSENNWDMNYLLDRMQAYGISVVAYARQRTADGSKYSGDDWDGVTKPDYADHPALIGFLMKDEPSAQDFTSLQKLKEQFEAVMPADKIFYVNLYSESAAKSAWYGSVFGSSNKDYEADYVDPFIGKLDPDVLSWDSYPLLTGKGIRTGYFHNFELMGTKNVTKWFTLLSSGHDTTSTSYDVPTYEELRWQMAVAMTYGVSNLDHYIYTSHAEDYSTMLDYDTQTVTDLYYDVLKADNEIKAWDEIYMAYTWLGTAGVKAGASSTMLDKLENEIDLTQNGLSAVSTNVDLLVGAFEYDGTKAYMVTNAGSAGSQTVGDGKNYITADATVTLTLDDADYKCVAVIDNGEISYVAVNADNTVTLNVEAYEGVFVIPVLN